MLFRKREPAKLRTVTRIAGAHRVATMDAECIDVASDYVGVVEQLRALTGEALRFDRVECVEDHGARRLTLRHGERVWVGLLLGDTDWLDEPVLVATLNQALRDQGAPGRLLWFDAGYVDQTTACAYLERDQATLLAGAIEQPLAKDGDPPELDRVWAGEPNGLPLQTHSVSNSEISGVAVSPDGGLVVSTGGDEQVRSWDLSGFCEGPAIAVAQCRGVVFDSAGDLLVGTAAGVQRLRLDGTARSTLGQRQVRSLSTDRARTRLAAGVDDGEHAWVELWDLETSRLLAEHRVGRGSLYVASAPAGDRFAAVGELGQGRVWSDRGERLLEERDRGAMWGVSFSPDGARLALGAEDGAIAIYDMATRACIGELEAPVGVWALAYSPDGHMLAVAGGDGVHVFDLTRNTSRLLSGAEYGASCLAWLPDGRVAAGGIDARNVARVQLWTL